jgi:hypothetical protein
MAVLAIVPYLNAQQVGLTAADFRVDESGAATYSVPIPIAPGTAGVAPQLALSYSSNNMIDGPVGVGWSIAGLSAISRCPKTPIHDQAINSITYTKEDRLCLDGQRLILTSGTYHAPYSKYHTEIANFKTITAYGGNASDGPQYFIVENHKAGEKHYYGNVTGQSFPFDASDAFVEPGGFEEGELAKSWVIKAIEDVKNNYIQFNYKKDTEVGSHYLDRVLYTGNKQKNIAPYAMVVFKYNDYEKGFKGYAAGGYTTHNQLLSEITSYINGEQYRILKLAFENSEFIEQRTLLTNIQECTVQACLEKTHFDWRHLV